MLAIEAEDEESLRRLRVGKADVALIQEYVGDEQERDPRLVYREAVVDELRLVLPPGSNPNVRLRRLNGTRWLV